MSGERGPSAPHIPQPYDDLDGPLGRHGERVGIAEQATGAEHRWLRRPLAGENGVRLSEGDGVGTRPGSPTGLAPTPGPAGADAIRGLVATATTARTPTVPMRAATGNADAAAKLSLLGKPAPDVTLSTLDGERMGLSAFITGPTALLFRNPGCGPGPRSHRLK